MAASRDIKDLCNETTCPICMDYFADPVTISECGHNFCQACLDQYWALDEGHALLGSCPQCKETTQRKHRNPNRALKNIVEIAKKLSLQGQEGVCQKHQEPLKLFCKDHQVSICLVCDKSKEHQNHRVVTQEEVIEEYKDIVKILQRSEKEVSMNCVVFPPELICRIRGLCDVKSLLEDVREQFPASAANITLDPDTAHPLLSLAEDLKSVNKQPRYQVLPYKPERFDSITCVLGEEGFTTGRHFWDITMGGEGWWGVGVARKSVQRKVSFIYCPKTGIGGVGKRRGQYKVVGSQHYMYLTQKIKRIRVTPNNSKGLVSFSDPDTGNYLFTHSGTFYGETLHPFFYVPFKRLRCARASLSEAVTGSIGSAGFFFLDLE